MSEKKIVKYFEICSYNSSNNYVLEKTTYVMGVAESNKGIEEPGIQSMTLKNMNNPESEGGRTYDENLDLCAQRCLDSDKCNGIMVSKFM